MLFAQTQIGLFLAVHGWHCPLKSLQDKAGYVLRHCVLRTPQRSRPTQGSLFEKSKCKGRLVLDDQGTMHHPNPFPVARHGTHAQPEK